MILLKCFLGIDRAVIKNHEGVRISSRTSIQTLFDQKFVLSINDSDYEVTPPQLESLSKEDLRKISDVKLLVSQLYEALHIEEYQLAREQLTENSQHLCSQSTLNPSAVVGLFMITSLCQWFIEFCCYSPTGASDFIF